MKTITLLLLGSLSCFTLNSFAGNPGGGGNTTPNCSSSCSNTVAVSNQSLLISSSTQIPLTLANATLNTSLHCYNGASQVLYEYQCNGITNAAGSISSVCSGRAIAGNTTIHALTYISGDTPLGVCQSVDGSVVSAILYGPAQQQIPTTTCTITCS